MLEISLELIKIVNFIYLFQNSIYQWITIVVTTFNFNIETHTIHL